MPQTCFRRDESLPISGSEKAEGILFPFLYLSHLTASVSSGSPGHLVFSVFYRTSTQEEIIGFKPTETLVQNLALNRILGKLFIPSEPLGNTSKTSFICFSSTNSSSILGAPNIPSTYSMRSELFSVQNTTNSLAARTTRSCYKAAKQIEVV